MNLTDLQLELRSIEEHIANLHSEIEKMKPQPVEEKKADYKQITKLAEKNPIKINSIFEAAIETKKIIITSLAYMLLLDESDFYNRLLYLCRLAKGCGYDATAEDIYKSGLEFEMSDINNLCNTIAEYKYSYLVEALLIANYSKEASVEVLSLIADVAQLLDVSKEQLRVLGTTAKGVLMNDMDILLDIPVPSKNMWSGKLRDYLPIQWIEDKRYSCGILCTKQYVKRASRTFGLFLAANNSSADEYKELSPCTIKNRLQAGSIVRKGDVICTYIEQAQKEAHDSAADSILAMGMLEPEYVSKEKSIVAPCDGIVYFVDGKKNGIRKDKPDEFIAIYVVSYFDDYSEFVVWHQKKFATCNK